MNAFVRVLGGAALLALAACGGAGAFGLTSEDNNPDALRQAFAIRQSPAKAAPKNATGKPLALLVTRASKAKGKAGQLIAFDLQARDTLWSTEASVASRVLVGREFVAHLDDGGALIGRDVRTGAQLWSTPTAGEFLGAAADAERVYYVVKDTSGSKKVWWLVALDGKTGAELWRADAPGTLGAPAAQGGLVFSPFLNQWLAVLDARTGEQIARIRGIDEEISFVRTTATDTYFGSKAGVFLLDERAASGKRAESTYGSAKLPEEFVRTHYYWDAFDRIQAGYSAYDRNRILWRGEPAGDTLAFQNGQVVVHTYRFFFAFDAKDGTLQWAYNHPRADAVASTHAGGAIAFATGLGELRALDPATGAPVYEAKIDAGRIIGATFDVEGWAPREQVSEPPSTVEALASIARDRDARFGDVKRFAVAQLATLPGGDVTGDLLGLLYNERTPPKLAEKVVEVLIARKDPAGLPHLVERLSVPHDFVTGSAPGHVDVLARTIAAMGDAQLDSAMREKVVEALLANLRAPQTPMKDLPHLVSALAAVGKGAERLPLTTFLLMYRSDAAFGAEINALTATIDALLQHGGARERAAVMFVAEDPATMAPVAEYAQRALRQTRASGD